MANIPTITYVLDGIGLFGALVGGAVAARSKYAETTSKQAALLIDTQTKRIDSLEDTIKSLTKELHSYREDNSKMMGELTAYKKMALVSPEIISKLTSTLDNILATLVKDGIHVDTQNIETQVVKKIAKK